MRISRIEIHREFGEIGTTSCEIVAIDGFGNRIALTGDLPEAQVHIEVPRLVEMMTEALAKDQRARRRRASAKHRLRNE